MTRPKPRSIMPGSTARVRRSAPWKFTISRSNTSSPRRRNGPVSAPPALLTRISIGVSRRFGDWAGPMDCASVMSAVIAPRAWPADNAARSAASSRPSAVTSMPAADSAAATARPMPLPPPVTSACRRAVAIHAATDAEIPEQHE